MSNKYIEQLVKMAEENKKKGMSPIEAGGLVIAGSTLGLYGVDKGTDYLRSKDSLNNLDEIGFVGKPNKPAANYVKAGAKKLITKGR